MSWAPRAHPGLARLLQCRQAQGARIARVWKGIPRAHNLPHYHGEAM